MVIKTTDMKIGSESSLLISIVDVSDLTNLLVSRHFHLSKAQEMSSMGHRQEALEFQDVVDQGTVIKNR
jgi:hypothetical protein